MQDLCRFANAFVDLISVHLAKLQSECHVVIHGHMGVERIALEYHCDIAVFGSHIVDTQVVNVEITFRNVFQTRNHTQSCGLAAAGGAYKNDKFLIGNLQIETLYRGDCVVVYFLYAIQLNCCHNFLTVEAMPPQILPREERAKLSTHYDRSPHCRTAGPGGYFLLFYGSPEVMEME